MTDNRIPLFRIPFLALRLIMDHYSFYEVIQLSLCSKRSLRVAKQCWKKKGLINTALYANKTILYNPNRFHNTASYYTFSIYSAKDLQDQQVHNIRVGDSVVPSVHKDNETITYWEDKIHGIGQIVSFIKNLFDVPIDWISLEAEECPNEFIRTFDCVMNLQGSVKECTLTNSHPIDECLTHLLNNCKITKELRIIGRLTKQFKNDWNVHLNSLQMSYGSCFTFQNLTNIDCECLWLDSSNFTNEDLNQFLKHWQNGGNHRIKYLSIVLNSLDQETVTSEIDTVTQPEGLHRYYEFMNARKNSRFGGIDIRRNDGTVGTIFFGRNNTFDFGVDLLPVNF